jgi:hypothetical protein
LEVITEGDYESSLEYFDGKFNELADYFVDSHFVNRKEIKWKEIYDLININHITDKFEQMLGNNPHFVNDENRTYINDDEDEDNKIIREMTLTSLVLMSKKKNKIILLYLRIVLAINSFLAQGFQIDSLFFNFAYFFSKSQKYKKINPLERPLELEIIANRQKRNYY